MKWVVAGLVALATWGAGELSAADHTDAPAAIAEPAADITDVFAWVTSDKSSLNLILNVFPNADAGARFSDAVRYVFHVASHATASSATSSAAEGFRLICEFTTDQLISCRLGDTVLVESRDASAEQGIASADGTFRVFAGLRDDPFFMAFANFTEMAAELTAMADSLTRNAGGCPNIPEAQRQLLVDTLTGNATAPTNAFAGQNVLSLVIQATKTLFGAGPYYTVWASTHRKE